MQQVSGKLRRGNEPHEPSEGKQRAPWSLAFPFPTFPSTDRHAKRARHARHAMAKTTSYQM